MRKEGHQRAIDALMDEYGKALDELYAQIENLQAEEMAKILDPKTDDADCKSIQSILRHVVESGHGYIVEIDRYGGGKSERQSYALPKNASAAIEALKNMYQANLDFFENNQHIPLYAKEPEKKILVRWGQRYDVDQLLEHAVMHVHRHRRQIVNFKQLL